MQATTANQTVPEFTPQNEWCSTKFSRYT